MEIKFLGTSSGSPSLYRNVSASAINFERTKSWLLVDCGEGTQHQMLKFGQPAYHLAVIAITHVHGDHCYGLPGLLAAIMVSGRKEAVHLIAPKKVIQFVQTTLDLTDLKLGFELRTHSIEACNLKLEFDFCSVSIVELKHRVPSYGFKITEKQIPKKLRLDKLKENGISTGSHLNRLQKGCDTDYQGRTLLADEYTYQSWRPRCALICGDNEKPSVLSGLCHDVDVLVHEATFTSSDLRKVGLYTGHSDAFRIAQFATQQNLKTLILNHFSLRYHGEGMLAPLQQEASSYFDGELLFAFDGMGYVIAKQANE